MSLPEIVTREEWVAARTRLLAAEKEATRAKDALNTQRRMLPMVRIDKKYAFEGPEGTVGLADLFDGSRQLVVQHVMFGPDWDSPCPGCSAGIDEIADGMLRHLRSRDTRYVLVSRAPAEKIRAAQAERGWAVPWYSSYGSDFNYDFHATLDESVAPIEFNFRDRAALAAHGDEWLLDGEHEVPGCSCFLRAGDEVYHTYSTWARGTEQADGSYGVLDMTALGRQEEWEEPKGRAPRTHGADPTFTD